MADFPKLEPAARPWGPGRFNGADVRGIAGTFRRMVHITSPIEQPLTLPFRLLSLAEMDLIRDHFRDHSTHVPFRLPAIVWCGRATIFNTTAWKYTGQPKEQVRSGLLFDVTVQLVSVPDVVARTTTDP